MPGTRLSRGMGSSVTRFTDRSVVELGRQRQYNNRDWFLTTWLRPDLSRISQIRFLTEFDYPPFNYAGPDGNPAGFNVELARLICEELKLQCTIQLRRFDTLLSWATSYRGEGRQIRGRFGAGGR